MKENKKAELKVSGMVCAACTAAIEKALQKLDGVSRASVNLGSETASVEYDPERVSLVDLERAVRDAGYDVIDEKVVLRIGGMVCAMCVGALEIALKKLDGVVDVRVNLAAEKAYVTFNPRMVGLEDMKKAVLDAGYQFLGLAGEEAVADREREALEKDLADKKRRIIVGFSVSLFLMAIMYLPVHEIVPMSICMAVPNFMSLFMLVVSAPAFVYVSRPIFQAALRALKNRNLDMDVMYGMGIGVAYGSSILGTFGIVLTPDFMFYETAVMLASFLTLGRYLEARAKGRTSEAIKKLVGLQPRRATILKDGREEEVAVEEVLAGDVLIVRPGERIPADGVVREGESYVDESMITGESIPALKAAGQPRGGRHPQQERLTAVLCQPGGKRHRPGPDHLPGGRSTGQPAAGAEDSRPGGGLFHPRHSEHSRRCICLLVFCGPQYIALLAHHPHIRISGGLPLCAGPGYAYRHHRGHRQGGGAGHPHQERRGSGGLGEA